MTKRFGRRDLLKTAATAGGMILGGGAPAILRGQNAPTAEYGAMVGDLVPGRAMLWSRASKASRMIVNWGTTENLGNRIVGPHCLDITDYTGRVELRGLPNNQTIFYEVTFDDLAAKNSRSAPVKGSFRTVNTGGDREVRVLWSGDTAGQGYGINPDFGGMKIYETMRALRPDFFIHSGDTIYADGPIQASVSLAGGGTWRNVVTEEKSKVAETLAEFRGAYKYNLMDANVRRFHSEVPQVWQWDDHEVTNNWSGSKDLSTDTRYTEKNVPLLVGRATKAFLEYAPVRTSAEETERVYRQIPFGPNLDVFVIDMRSYRGPNSDNQQTSESAATDFLGAAQVDWLQQGLKNSRAVWKVIAADMPIGLLVGDGRDALNRPRFENGANGDGPARGRELETARLLKYIKDNNIQNIVWVTADTHYTAAHFYNPDRAQFKDFLPFWEFMSGPLNAGSFGPSATDDTFGIEVVYKKHPDAGQANLAPSAGLQFFGEIRVSPFGNEMVVNLRDIGGNILFTKILNAAR